MANTSSLPTADPEHLFQPIRIGDRTSRNRIVLPPNGANQSEAGLYNEGIVRYYGDVAARTAGLIVTGASVVHPTSAMPKLQRIYDPANSPWLAALADEVHKSDTLLVCQLMHLGSHLRPVPGEPCWMPSPVPTEWIPDVVRGMNLAEIDDVREAFAFCAGLLTRAGWDGVELHATHGYLLQEFHSPRSNQRADRYGGSPENRERLLVEILTAWREMPNAPAIVGMRISGGETVSDGLQWTDVLDTCDRFSRAGLVDYISLTIPTADDYVKDAAYPVAGLAPMSAQLKALVSVPVIVSQRITTPEIGAGIISAGHADLIAIGRGLVADPAWGEKAASGRSSHIRPCIACMEDCRTEGPYSGSRSNKFGGYGCILNPGAYQVSGPLRSLAEPTRVVVVGAGPAGAEAAMAAAEARADVVVVEAALRAGGRARLAGQSPHRSEWITYADYLDTMLRDHPRIRLQFGEVAGIEMLADLKPDVVIAAVGAVPMSPPQHLGNRVVHTDDFLRSSDFVTGDWLVIDDVGRWDAVNSVETLAAAGCSVTYATKYEAVGPRIPLESRADVLRRFADSDVQIVRLLSDITISNDAVMLTTADGRVIVAPAPAGIVWGGAMRSESIGEQWEAALQVPVWAIGDGLSPRGLSLATKEGAAVGNRLVEAAQRQYRA